MLPRLRRGPSACNGRLGILIIDSILTQGRMSKVCEAWSLEDLCDMDENDMGRLLGFFRSGAVPSFEQIRVGEEPGVFAFDGSFGWYIGYG